MPDPFLLRTPTDMLEKAKRELVKLTDQTSPDTIFNFFVTAYHVMDYVKRLGTVSQTAIDNMYADPDFELCNLICNRGKHLILTRTPRQVTAAEIGGGGFNASAFNEYEFNASPEWKFFCDNVEIQPLQLAKSIIGKWEGFFHANGI